MRLIIISLLGPLERSRPAASRDRAVAVVGERRDDARRHARDRRNRARGRHRRGAAQRRQRAGERVARTETVVVRRATAPHARRGGRALPRKSQMQTERGELLDARVVSIYSTALVTAACVWRSSRGVKELGTRRRHSSARRRRARAPAAALALAARRLRRERECGGEKAARARALLLHFAGALGARRGGVCSLVSTLFTL